MMPRNRTAERLAAGRVLKSFEVDAATAQAFAAWSRSAALTESAAIELLMRSAIAGRLRPAMMLHREDALGPEATSRLVESMLDGRPRRRGKGRR